MIADHNSLDGRWTSVHTKAESKLISEANAIYAKAYLEKKAELEMSEYIAKADSSGLDIQV
ncbi:hypothetical protein D7X33_21985 [Butyricicoccus sp. 1XD8-22]|nr:hypothetical protein D7X33_21985 [Butyricicoccus sp. 1XD8-22]